MDYLNSYKSLFKSPLLMMLLGVGAPALGAIEGSIGVESRYFTEASKHHDSILLNPEWLWSSQSNQHQFYIEVFARAEDGDDERSNVDVTEALWTYTPNSWELSAGVGKVFWGVAESNHLVDIINQTDLAESSDGEAKLGQPMLKASTVSDWGTVDLFILPYFRERRFPGVESPLGSTIKISELSLYEHSQEENHRDFSIRYSHYIDDWDFSVSYFDGTHRTPELIPTQAPGEPLTLTPYYQQLTQIGTTVQATLNAWLWKLEAIHRDLNNTTYGAFTAGFEYTLFGIGDSAADFGFLAEFSRDSRGLNNENPLQKDGFLGARLTLNDVQDTNFLIGLSHDLDVSNQLFFVEANRRLGDSFRLTLDARIFEADNPQDPLAVFDQGDYLSLELEHFF